MSVGLLDVNMLIALAWPSHVHHGLARSWFRANQGRGWATCPLTQCGFVRVSSSSAAIPQAVSTREAIQLLRRIIRLPNHVFWPGNVGLLDAPVPLDAVVGHRQISDAYLLGLSIHHAGRLVTLDKSIAMLLATESPHRDAVEVVAAE